jgi:hypothetical protein
VASQPAAAVTVARPPVVQAELPADLMPEDPPCPPTPLRFGPMRTGPVFRHYAGTIGKEPASAELSWTHPDSVTGHCYRWRGGLAYRLKATRRHRGPLVLALSQEVADLGHPRGTWRLAAPLGPVLRGTWVDEAGRCQSFSLRESYRQAVPYTTQTLTLTGGRPTAGLCSPSLTQSYLHLLGHLRPAWQRVQAPPLAVRKRRLLATYEQDGDTSYFVGVCLNDFNLLSYQTSYTAFMEGGPRQDGLESALFDLATGRALTLGSQLQPGYQPPLRHLLAQQLLRDLNTKHSALELRSGTHHLAGPIASEESLLGHLALTGAGLEASYFPRELNVEAYSIPYTVVIPYRELRPLVRPGTPLARMLRARGMW